MKRSDPKRLLEEHLAAGRTAFIKELKDAHPDIMWSRNEKGALVFGGGCDISGAIDAVVIETVRRLRVI